MGTIAIIGDVGGHYKAFCKQLTALGVNTLTAEIPNNLTIVQVGDLIHKGSDSPQVLALVNALNETGQWVQLIGNHEAQYLTEQQFIVKNQLEHEQAHTLQNNWDNRNYHAAVAVRREGKQEVLITHAGLTEQFWRLKLEAPTTATQAANRLEYLAHNNPTVFFRPGVMLTGEWDPFAGPVWAEAGGEVTASWRVAEYHWGTQLPFHMVHGHSCPVWWDRYDRGEVIWNAPKTAQDVYTLYPGKRHAVANLGGGRIIGIDPGHGKNPTPKWEPLMFEGEIVLPTPEEIPGDNYATALH